MRILRASLCLLLALCILLGACAMAEPVAFEDPVIESAIREASRRFPGRARNDRPAGTPDFFGLP